MSTHSTQRSPRRSKRPLRSALGSIVVIFVVLTAVGGCLNIGERLAFFPTRDEFVTPQGYEDVTFAASNGASLHGWFIPAKGVGRDAPAPTVLFTHGNAGNLKNHHAFCNFLAEHGMHVFLFDYQGYGRSDDTHITRHTVFQDAQDAYDMLRQRPDVDPDRIGIYGMSLGGQPALFVASQNPEIKAVATLSTFSSWEGIASDFVPILGPMLIDSGYDATQSAAELGDRPYLILHGQSDSIVNPRHAPILNQAATQAGVNTEIHLYPNGNHISMLWTHPESAQELVDFFKEHLSAQTAQPDQSKQEP